MSGPKISVYSLTGRAKEIIAGQIKCEQRSAIYAKKIQAILKSISLVNANFDRQIGNIRLLIKRTGKGEEQLERILELENTFRKDAEEIRRVIKAYIPRVSANYTISEQALEEKRAEMKKLEDLLDRAENLKKALDEAFDDDRINTEEIQREIPTDLAASDKKGEEERDMRSLRRANDRNIQEIRHSILDDISGIYSFEMTEIPDPDDLGIEECRTAVRHTLVELLQNEALPPEITEDIRKAAARLGAISDMQGLRTFSAITVSGIRERIHAYCRELERKQAAFAELVFRYRTLCEMTGNEARELPYSHETEELLTSEIERLESIALRDKEKEYIADCIDQVMTEMGYDLIGEREVIKKSGKRFRNELFTFHEGTAVNVTYSSDGQISLELGGIAREDRIPNGEESKILTHDMEVFCGEFAEFERRLRERGVLVGKRIALSPPSVEYAAIININDYDLNENARITEMDVKEKRRRAGGKKAMQEE